MRHFLPRRKNSFKKFNVLTTTWRWSVTLHYSIRCIESIWQTLRQKHQRCLLIKSNSLSKTLKRILGTCTFRGKKKYFLIVSVFECDQNMQIEKDVSLLIYIIPFVLFFYAIFRADHNIGGLGTSFENQQPDYTLYQMHLICLMWAVIVSCWPRNFRSTVKLLSSTT